MSARRVACNAADLVKRVPEAMPCYRMRILPMSEAAAAAAAAALRKRTPANLCNARLARPRARDARRGGGRCLRLGQRSAGREPDRRRGPGAPVPPEPELRRRRPLPRPGADSGTVRRNALRRDGENAFTLPLIADGLNWQVAERQASIGCSARIQQRPDKPMK